MRRKYIYQIHLLAIYNYLYINICGSYANILLQVFEYKK